MKKSPRYNQEAKPGQCKPKLEEIYLSKPGNWPSQYEFTGTMLENPSEEAIFESSQIKEYHEKIKLLNEEVMINE